MSLTQVPSLQHTTQSSQLLAGYHLNPIFCHGQEAYHQPTYGNCNHIQPSCEAAGCVSSARVVAAAAATAADATSAAASSAAALVSQKHLPQPLATRCFWLAEFWAAWQTAETRHPLNHQMKLLIQIDPITYLHRTGLPALKAHGGASNLEALFASRCSRDPGVHYCPAVKVSWASRFHAVPRKSAWSLQPPREV